MRDCAIYRCIVISLSVVYARIPKYGINLMSRLNLIVHNLYTLEGRIKQVFRYMYACALMRMLSAPLSKSRIDCNGISMKIRSLSERSMEIPLTFIITTSMRFKFFEKYFLDTVKIFRHLNIFLLLIL